MSRGLVIFLIIVVLIAIFGFWGLPVIKQRLFGESMQTHVNIISAVDSFDVEFRGKQVSRTVVEMEIFFPMGGAPENLGDLKSELMVVNDQGKPYDVIWGRPESREDIPEKGQTRWLFKPAYFEIGFRGGMLKNKFRDLCYFTLKDVKSE